MHEHEERPRFAGGANIAIKVPDHEYTRTVHFYREIIGLDVVVEGERHTAFAFGGQRLWLDRAPQLSQAEVWLELTCDRLDTARAYLSEQHVPRRDGVEAIPVGTPGFWITSPADIIHLVTGPPAVSAE